MPLNVHRGERTPCVYLSTFVQILVKWIVSGKWRGVYDETWESQELNDTYKTSSDVSVSRNLYKTVLNWYENLYMYV